MLRSSLIDIIILVVILGFIGTINTNNLSTLQGLGLLSSIGWIVLLIFRLIKQGKNSGPKAGTKPNVKQKKLKR